MDNFDIHKWQAKFLKESVEFKTLDDKEQLDDVPSVSLQIIDDHEEGDSPKLFLELSAMYHSGGNGKIKVLKDRPELQEKVMQAMQVEVQKTFRNVIHSILGEPFGLDEKKSAIQEGEGYIEVMGPDFDQAIHLLQTAWKEWKNGPMTEPEDIPQAKQDILEYIGSLIK
jgi:polyhydroxyalkanoate synthesis regulator protein